MYMKHINRTAVRKEDKKTRNREVMEHVGDWDQNIKIVISKSDN